MKKNQSNETRRVYSIRKTAVAGAASVLIGTFGSMMLPAVSAEEVTDTTTKITYKYVQYDSLSSEEKANLVSQLPEKVTQNATYYLVYSPNAGQELPQTGASSLALPLLIGTGTLIIAVQVLEKDKKKKQVISSVLLVTAVGGSLFAANVDAVTANFDSLTKTYTLHVGDEMPDGRLSIDGFTFVGAIEKEVSPSTASTTQGETTSVLTTEEVTHETGTTEVTAPVTTQEAVTTEAVTEATTQTASTTESTTEVTTAGPIVNAAPVSLVPEAPSTTELPSTETETTQAPTETTTTTTTTEEEKVVIPENVLVAEVDKKETILSEVDSPISSEDRSNMKPDEAPVYGAVVTEEKKFKEYTNGDGKKVEELEVHENKPVQPGVEYIADPELPFGETRVEQEGEAGVYTELYDVRKEDGVVVDKSLKTMHSTHRNKRVRIGVKKEAPGKKQTIQENVTLKAGVQYVEQPELEVGRQNTLKVGKDGKRTSTIEIQLNAVGEEVSRKVIQVEQTPAEDAVIEIGTKKAGNAQNKNDVDVSKLTTYRDGEERNEMKKSYDHNAVLSDPVSVRQGFIVGTDIPIQFSFANTQNTPQALTAQVDVYHLNEQVGQTLRKTVLVRAQDTVNVADDAELQKTFTIPGAWLKDYTGYIVKVSVKNQEGSTLEFKILGLAVESDWTKFPRYAAIAGSQNYGNSMIDDPALKAKYAEEFDELKNMHINGHFYYDVYKNPTDPLPAGDQILNQEWNWWTHSKIDPKVLRELVDQSHKDGAVALLYNMISARSNFDDKIPVGDEHLVYNYESGFFGDKGTPMRNPMLKSPYEDKLRVFQEYFNPKSKVWQEFIAKRMAEAMKTGNFDGWQGDTIGDTRVTDYDNRNTNDIDKSFLMSDTFVDFARRMKELIPDKYFTLNAVGGQGLRDLARDGNQDVVYAEIWANGDVDDNKTQTGRYHTEYGDLKRLVDQVRAESGKSLIVAAYMELPGDGNKSGQDEYFNTDAVLLVDATVAASGGYHMTAVAGGNSKHEFGVGVLDAPYYPSQGLKVGEELNRRLYNYQQFITAYENILRGDGVENDDVLAKVYDRNQKQLSYDDNNDPMKSGIYGDQVWTFTKKGPGFKVVQMINCLGINTDWTNKEGTSAKNGKSPKTEQELTLTYPLHGLTKEQAELKAKNVYIASPDEWAKGQMLKADAEVKMLDDGEYTLVIKVPELRLWNVVYIPE